MAIFDDRIEISNHGTLNSRLTIPELSGAHPSILRNPKIAHVLYLGNYIEQWGTGANKIIGWCKAAGVTPPKFAQLLGHLYVTLFFAQPIGPTIINASAQSDNFVLTTEIVKLLKQHTGLSFKDFRVYLPQSVSSRQIGDVLVKLKKEDLVYVEGVRRAAKWYAK